MILSAKKFQVFYSDDKHAGPRKKYVQNEPDEVQI